MTTTEIGQKLVALCGAEKFEEAYTTLFADTATSTEPSGEVVTGLAAMFEKAKVFDETNAISNMTVRGPYVSGDIFAVHFAMTMTTKATGEAMAFEEVALYTVADGKITSESFLYGV